MILAYIAKLDMKRKLINIGTQKIDSLLLETYHMILACFLLQDSQKSLNNSFKRLFC